MTTSQTKRITASYVYEYANELVVELTGEDGNGDIVVRSYQFEPQGDAVEAKTPVEAPFASHVAEALAEKEYDWQRD